MTLWEYLGLWLETYVAPKRARKTVEAYQYALNHLSQAAREAALDALTPLQLQREVNALAAVYSRQAQLLYVALRAALTRAARLQMIQRNPMDMVEPPAHSKREISYLTAPEAAAYLAAAQEDPRGPLLVLMLCLGLRRNEARGLRGSDLDAEGLLHVRRQRTAQGDAPLKSRASCRDIPVPEPLRAFFRGKGRGYLVDCSETALRRSHVAILARIGVHKQVTLHGLRHSCASLAIASGSQLLTVQRLLGHAHYSITADTYCHLDRQQLAQTVAKILQFTSPSMEQSARLEIV